MNQTKSFRKLKTSFRLITAGLLFFLLGTLSLQAKEVFTNESIKEELEKTVAFRKSHSVMSENQNRLHSLLNAFLTGDLSSVRTLTSEISASLEKVTSFLPADGSELQVEGWKAIATVCSLSREIEKSIAKEDFAGAYNHYAQLTFQCIQCHQAVRSYGKFAVPKSKEPPAPAATEAEPKDKSAAP